MTLCLCFGPGARTQNLSAIPPCPPRQQDGGVTCVMGRRQQGGGQLDRPGRTDPSETTGQGMDAAGARCPEDLPRRACEVTWDGGPGADQWPQSGGRGGVRPRAGGRQSAVVPTAIGYGDWSAAMGALMSRSARPLFRAPHGDSNHLPKQRRHS